jgi:hypothetical protein
LSPPAVAVLDVDNAAATSLSDFYFCGSFGCYSSFLVQLIQLQVQLLMWMLIMSFPLQSFDSMDVVGMWLL